MVFLVYWLSFVQLMYLLFNVQLEQFSSFKRSMETCFEMILGNKANIFISSDLSLSFLGIIVYVLFIITFVAVLINIFLTIINENYVRALNDKDLDNQDIGMFDYLKSIFGIKNESKNTKINHAAFFAYILRGYNLYLFN
jgi:ABC-type bacteriocin/lantibiotic exporter with double-glycine peptidase domain